MAFWNVEFLSRILKRLVAGRSTSDVEVKGREVYSKMEIRPAV